MYQFTRINKEALTVDTLPDDALFGDYLINIVKSKGHCLRTRPASLTVEDKDRITWLNKLDHQVEVTFYPKDTPLDYRMIVFTIEPGSYKQLVLSDPVAGEYAYVVYCRPLRLFADGDSDPKIIVLQSPPKA
jgi:plastocyanin